MGTKIKNIIVSLLVITINTLCLVVFTTLLKIFLNDFSQLSKIKTETLIRLVTLNNIAAVIIAKFIFYKIQGIFLPNNIFTISILLFSTANFNGNPFLVFTLIPNLIK